MLTRRTAVGSPTQSQHMNRQHYHHSRRLPTRYNRWKRDKHPLSVSALEASAPLAPGGRIGHFFAMHHAIKPPLDDTKLAQPIRVSVRSWFQIMSRLTARAPKVNQPLSVRGLVLIKVHSLSPTATSRLHFSGHVWVDANLQLEHQRSGNHQVYVPTHGRKKNRNHCRTRTLR